jgi:tellurite resistance protein TerC
MRLANEARRICASRWPRKIAVGVAGFSVLAAGLALIVLPGPAVVVIPIGLAILAKEFPWARKLLDWLKSLVRKLWIRVRAIVHRLVGPRPVPGP